MRRHFSPQGPLGWDLHVRSRGSGNSWRKHLSLLKISVPITIVIDVEALGTPRLPSP